MDFLDNKPMTSHRTRFFYSGSDVMSVVDCVSIYRYMFIRVAFYAPAKRTLETRYPAHFGRNTNLGAFIFG